MSEEKKMYNDAINDINIKIVHAKTMIEKKKDYIKKLNKRKNKLEEIESGGKKILFVHVDYPMDDNEKIDRVGGIELKIGNERIQIDSYDKEINEYKNNVRKKTEFNSKKFEENGNKYLTDLLMNFFTKNKEKIRKIVVEEWAADLMGNGRNRKLKSFVIPTIKKLEEYLEKIEFLTQGSEESEYKGSEYSDEDIEEEEEEEEEEE